MSMNRIEHMYMATARVHMIYVCVYYVLKLLLFRCTYVYSY